MSVSNGKSPEPNSSELTPEKAERAANLEAAVSKLKRIPMLSQLSTDIIREIDNPNISCRRLAEIISTDPVIVAELLKLTNSAYFGIRVRVSSVQQATSLLGVNLVSNLVVSLALMDSPKAYAEIPYFDVHCYWGHCMATSQICGVVARKLGSQMVAPGEASLAGLLHDIGIIVFAANEKKKFSQIFEEHRRRYDQAVAADQKPPDFSSVEEEFLGFSHADLGAWLAEKWGLPLPILETIRFHHSPVKDCLNKETVALVQLSDFLCNRNRLDFLPPYGDPEIMPETLQMLGRSGQKDFQEKLKSTIQPEIERARHYFEAFATVVREEEDEVKEETPTAVEEQLPSETQPEVVIVEKPAEIPLWTSLVPGLYQILRGEIVPGVLILMIFLVGAGFSFLFSLMGSPVPAFWSASVGVLAWFSGIVLAWAGKDLSG